ncbi:TetR family transcriptional regulator, partial [Pseudonocardia sp. KRD-188]
MSTAQKAGPPSGNRTDRVEERRRELAAAALTTLSELGYARTSLREIAQNSAFSHGVLHYYFRDKVDLITYCVRQYKAACVLRYDQIVATAGTADALATGFADGLVATLVEDARMHRLWYDLRSQSLFEESFRPDVLDIDATLERMVW